MILQRYILRELVVTFVLAFAAVVGVCAVGVIFQAFRSYEGMNLTFILRLAPMALTQMSPWAMIVASCLSATLVYGRLSADNELDAIRTSGIHVSRIIMPALLFGLFLCAVAHMIYGEAAPRARYARRQLIRETLTLVLRHPPGGRQNEVKIGGRNRLSYADTADGNLEKPVLLILGRDATPQFLYFARRGVIDMPEDGAPAITLFDGSFTEFNLKLPADHPARVRSEGHLGEQHTVTFDLEDAYRRKRGPADMPTFELFEFIGRAPQRYVAEALTEFHGRIARSLAPLVLVLLCAPIGVFVRKGSRLAGMGVALPPMIAYIVLIIVGEGLGGKGRINAAVATYGPVALLAGAAAWLLHRIARR